MSSTNKALGAQSSLISIIPIKLQPTKKIILSMAIIAMLSIRLFISNATIKSYGNTKTTLHWGNDNNATTKTTKHKDTKCPVKIFVYDLGFRNKTSELKKGFNVDTIRKDHYTYISSPVASEDHPWFIVQKFMQYSHCTVNEARDADFFILPPFTYKKSHNHGSETNRVLQTLEHEYNDTLFRRNQKDHIILNYHTTKEGYLLSRQLTNRSFELISPMVKVVIDVFVWGYPFERRNEKFAHAPEIIYDRLLTVPYASNMREFSGDIHEQRPYLVSFAGNGEYPLYRKKIVQQCQEAMEDPEWGDCFLGATNRSFASSKTAYDLYINSTFFFCPGGDSGTRKALFDGIALNSIPVVFEEISFDVAYPVYFPGNPRDYTVFLNTSDDMMGQLRAVSSARIAELQRNIARVRDSVSYIPNHDSFDATWMIMKQLEQYKLNGYKFFDRFPNKTTLNCVDKIEEFGGKCRLQSLQ